MKIISSVGAKGGTGKSSVALLLAWELSKKHDVVILDADVQGTCISAKNLNGNIPFRIYSIVNRKDLMEKGEQLEKEKCEYLILDCNPRSFHEDIELIEAIALLSDLSLIVSRPSPRDIKAQIELVDLLKAISKGQIRLLWNFYQKNTAAHREGVPQGEHLLSLKSLKTKIGLRIAYQDIGYNECHISELGNKEAVKEIQALTKEIKGMLYGQI